MTLTNLTSENYNLRKAEGGVFTIPANSRVDNVGFKYTTIGEIDGIPVKGFIYDEALAAVEESFYIDPILWCPIREMEVTA